MLFFYFFLLFFIGSNQVFGDQDNNSVNHQPYCYNKGDVLENSRHEKKSKNKKLKNKIKKVQKRAKSRILKAFVLGMQTAVLMAQLYNYFWQKGRNKIKLLKSIEISPLQLRQGCH